MPTYEYQCEVCSHEWEIEHGMSEKIKVECEKCKSDCVKKLIGATHFILKGSGWANDGYSK